MNSIESLTLDFNAQISELGKINNDKISDNLIFVGSGDSYVAGLITEYLTHHKCKCYSPSDLFSSELSRDGTYCFVSVTGRTKANISVAKRASQAGSKTVAITFNENSELAKVCDKIIHPNLKRAHTPTAGFGSFVANAVTCLQVAGITVPKKFDMWYQNAVKISKNVLESVVLPEDTVFCYSVTTLSTPLRCTRLCKWLNFLVLRQLPTNLKNFVTRQYLDSRG